LDFIAVGEVLVDVSAPALAPGRVVHAPVRVSAGGTAVNSALAAAAVGAQAAVVGRVGDDPAASAIRAALDAAGVTALLAVDDEAPTGTFVEAGAGEDAAIATDRGASARTRADDLPTALAAGAVLVSGYLVLHDDTAPAAAAALARADARWVAASLAAPRLIERLGAAEVHGRVSGANVLLMNEAEAGVLTGAEPERAASELAKRYELVCVTTGARGAVAAAGTRLERVPARGGGAATGAGDAFAGALLAALARGDDLLAALETAAVTGSARSSG
jgi:sugar/nucleoside kinase (ribokinase family)